MLLPVMLLYAGPSGPDSLREKLLTTPEDSTRVDLLLHIVNSRQDLDYADRLSHLNDALDLARSLGYGHGVARAAAMLGESHLELGNYSTATSYTLEALESFTTLRDTLGRARSTVNLGLIKYNLKQYDKALRDFDEAKLLYESAGNRRGMLIARHNTATTLKEKGAPEMAREVYLENLELLRDTEYWPFFAATYNNLGNLFKDEEKPDSALHFYRIALSYKERAPSKASIANTCTNIGSVLTLLGQYAEAEEFLLRGRRLAVESGAKERIMWNNEEFAKLEAARGDHAAAYDFLTEAIRLRDSLFGAEQAERVARQEAAFASEKQRAEIALLNEQTKVAEAKYEQFRMFLIGLVAFLLLLLGLLVFVLRRNRERARAAEVLQRKNEEIRRQQEEILAKNEALTKQNLRLEELNAEKDGLIGIVAHDIRAPLNRSAALAELVSSVGPVTKEQQKFLDMIRKVSDDGGRLIQDLLELNAYERMDARIDLERVDLRETVKTSLECFRKEAGVKDLKLHLDLPPAGVLAHTDEKLVSRIIDNLISNAIKFSHPGKNIYVGLSNGGDQVRLSVRDEGQGISEEDQKKMFRKFQRLTARPTGGESSTGLGLSIVKTLVERLEGRIEVDSQVDVGTEFRVSLPKER